MKQAGWPLQEAVTTSEDVFNSFFCQKTGNLRFVLTKLFFFFNVLPIDKCLEKLLIDSACLPYFGVLAKDPINSRV
jgi:hypothetical protein